MSSSTRPDTLKLASPTFGLKQSDMGVDPNAIMHPYDVKIVDDHEGMTWLIQVSFHNGKAYLADVMRRDGDKWWLMSFHEQKYPQSRDSAATQGMVALVDVDLTGPKYAREADSQIVMAYGA